LSWPKEPPPPPLPKEVIDKTRERYLEALRRLTGRGLDWGLKKVSEISAFPALTKTRPMLTLKMFIFLKLLD